MLPPTQVIPAKDEIQINNRCFMSAFDFSEALHAIPAEASFPKELHALLREKVGSYCCSIDPDSPLTAVKAVHKDSKDAAAILNINLHNHEMLLSMKEYYENAQWFLITIGTDLNPTGCSGDCRCWLLLPSEKIGLAIMCGLNHQCNRQEKALIHLLAPALESAWKSWLKKRGLN